MTRLVGKYVKCCRLKYDAWPSSRTYHMTERILYICGLQYVDLWINDSISNTLLALYIQSYIQDVNCSLKFEQRERGKVSVWKTTLSIDASFLIHHQSFAKKNVPFCELLSGKEGIHSPAQVYFPLGNFLCRRDFGSTNYITHAEQHL